MKPQRLKYMYGNIQCEKTCVSNITFKQILDNMLIYYNVFLVYVG